MQKTKKRSARREQKIATPTDAAPVRALKLKDAAKYLGISKPTTVRLVQRGLLRANRTLRHYLFPISELERFLEEGLVE